MKAQPWPREIKLIIGATAAAIIIACLLAFWVSFSFSLGYLAGILIGGASLGGVAYYVLAFTSRRLWRRRISSAIRLFILGAIAALLYLSVRVLHTEVLAIFFGYTYTLIFFAIYMALVTAQAQKADKKQRGRG